MRRFSLQSVRACDSFMKTGSVSGHDVRVAQISVRRRQACIRLESRAGCIVCLWMRICERLIVEWPFLSGQAALWMRACADSYNGTKVTIRPGEHEPRSAASVASGSDFREKVTWWRELDSNQRRRTPADLQSAPFSHSGISPGRDGEYGGSGLVSTGILHFCCMRGRLLS